MTFGMLWLIPPGLLLLTIIVVLSFLLIRSARRLLQFDDLFELLVHDIEVNVHHFDRLAQTPLLSDIEEVKTAHDNMKIMNARLKEYVLRIEELSGRRFRAEEKKPPNPPKVR